MAKRSKEQMSPGWIWDCRRPSELEAALLRLYSLRALFHRNHSGFLLCMGLAMGFL